MGYECDNRNCEKNEAGWCKCGKTTEYCKTKCCNKANYISEVDYDLIIEEQYKRKQ